ncbi:cell cycle control [Pyrenophora seminiperda CCB06]|uniref:Cell cycle control n=1 Tax=Pyrenophora seminiperda CCB06 TaxID=1302712 RepID=A0A3M7M9P9_9PLEO|nr:cell cycle control [Pyrenophora seminiperda CCB06]
MAEINKDLQDLAKTTTEDFYALLGVPFDADEAAIKKAYRKTSIRYHPDKNPDNKDAADRFIYLGWARDILIDETLKGEYDRARARRREKVLQDNLLDGHRRKMRDDLERREQEWKYRREREGKDFMDNLKRKRTEDLNEAERRELRRELDMQRNAEDVKRRRKELQERREKEQREYEQSLEEPPAVAAPKPGETPDIDRTVKVRFEREANTMAWDKDHMESMFSKYGKVDIVVMGKDKKIRDSGTTKHRKLIATVFLVYTRMDHAYTAVINARADYPALESVTWAKSEPDCLNNAPASAPAPVSTTPSAPSTPVSTPKNKSFRTSFGAPGGKGFGGTPPLGPLGTPKFSFSPKTPSLEEVAMMKLKQAGMKQAEKKRLEEQIRQQEAAEEAAAAEKERLENT